MIKNMTSYACKHCNKVFRGNYELNRHVSRKKPCINEREEPKIIFINNGIINNYTINIFGKEDLSHINIEEIVEKIREINKITNDEYVRAGKLVIKFHKLVNENSSNKNIKILSERSKIGKVIYENNQLISKPINDVVDETLKTRAGQLVSFKDTIHQHNQRVFKVPKNVNTWEHLEKFKNHGTAHQDTWINTRNFKKNLKLALL
jgi:hypothetical protein